MAPSELERSVFSELPPLQTSTPPGGPITMQTLSPLPRAITLGLQFMSDKHHSTVTRPGGDEGGLAILRQHTRVGDVPIFPFLEYSSSGVIAQAPACACNNNELKAPARAGGPGGFSGKIRRSPLTGAACRRSSPISLSFQRPVLTGHLMYSRAHPGPRRWP